MSNLRQSLYPYRWGLVGWAALVLSPAVMLSSFLHRKMTEHPVFRIVEGQLVQYAREDAYRAPNNTILFSLAGQPGRFWTQVPPAGWQPHRTQLRFYVQENAAYAPKDGDAVKTFGMWVDGSIVQSLEAKQREEAFHDKLIVLLDIVFYAMAVGALALAYAAFLSRRDAAP